MTHVLPVLDLRDADSDAAVVVGAVRFWLNGASTYRNSDRIVHLYDYLLAGARRTPRTGDGGSARRR